MNARIATGTGGASGNRRGARSLSDLRSRAHLQDRKVERQKERDVEAIKEAMAASPRARVSTLKPPGFGTDLALGRESCRVTRGKCGERTGGERGIRIQTHSRISNLLIRKTVPSPAIP